MFVRPFREFLVLSFALVICKAHWWCFTVVLVVVVIA